MTKDKPIISIGIDCGTSGVRVISINEHQQLLTSEQIRFSQQTVQHWWLLTETLLNQTFNLLNQSYRLEYCHIAISVDATSSSLFLMNPMGEPLTPIKMYYDSCTKEADMIANQLSPSSGAFGSQSSLAKVIQLKDQLNPSDNWLVCHQADWLLWNLTGKSGFSDENNCLKLGFDPKKREWEPATLNLIGPTHLPEALPPGSLIGPLKESLIKAWKLPQAPLIFCGTTDSIAAYLATGANEVGDAVVSLGSTLAFKLVCKQPYTNHQLGIYSHRLGNNWLVGGASNSGGACLLEAFNLETVNQLGIQTDPLSILPTQFYPLPLNRTGERFPIYDPNKKPQQLNDSLSETERFQQIISGLVSIEAKAWRLLSEVGDQAIHRLFASGGGNKNPAWAGYRLHQLPYHHAQPLSEDAAFGSALMAHRGLCSLLM